MGTDPLAFFENGPGEQTPWLFLKMGQGNRPLGSF
ncbi:hypothetical protein B14911_16605 [Bacillus sp. NRRL B-14911]|uniref:Uncharacterized protein n=1 Tax=Bacillus infantis NRRL B-14911 TaxID=1367477 RepID=U5L642_9BACI|nr:hypothetical protein N288_04330 [Bacillus infantis NRRL B-14911]EAR67152.1 hypothetical protein B14911_16605 [Bacillus sp. NRRL B-14911]